MKNVTFVTFVTFVLLLPPVSPSYGGQTMTHMPTMGEAQVDDPNGCSLTTLVIGMIVPGWRPAKQPIPA